MTAPKQHPDQRLVDALRASVKETERLREQNQSLLAEANDPVVVVGVGCRFPGGVDSLDSLWGLLSAGVDGTSPFPTDRGWDLETVINPDPAHSGTSYVSRGGFLADAGGFDAGFFRISPREALAMDPQHRLLVETTWDALETAGLDPHALRGSATGVFAGIMYADYGSGADRAAAGVEGLLGVGGSLASGRVSYTYGFEGPAVTIDTACSSSLVAVHLAAQAIRAGECDRALAGGVTVMATPDTFIDFSRQRGLAPDGRCKPFSDDADGTAWGEGAGMLLLERHSAARAAGHRILAVLRGSAINQDGASNGLTAPNGPAQQRVIRAALRNARLGADQIHVIQAHGTGTALGDPIEAQALHATYGTAHTPDQPVLLGSVKANLGHTQAAAGIAGILTLITAIHHRQVPATLNITTPSHHIDWSSGTIALPTGNTPWPETDGPRRAAVSSFGISGTNAHLILEEGDAPVVTPDSEPAGPLVWPVSARTASALAAQARRLLTAVETGTLHPADVAATLATRATHTHRGFATGRTADELLAGLRDLADSGPASNAPTRTAVVFTGQGAQWAGMGASLHATYPVFAATFDEICAAFDKTSPTDVSLRDVVFGDTDGIDDTTWTQPALFALETALYRLLESFGVTAAVVAGHSVGEITAAHIAGLLTLPDAVRLVEARARLMGALPAGGAMAAVNTDETTLRALLPAGVEIAASNAPTSLVVSGPEEAVLALLDTIKSQGIRGKQLTVSHAFHSALMTPMLDDFTAAITGIQYGTPTIPIVSTLTGGPADMANATYWADQIRGTVRYADAVTTIADQHHATAILEIGPDAALTPVTTQTVDLPVIPTLRRGHDQHTAVLTALATLWTTGHPIDWTTHSTGHHIDLPTYAFEREQYWLMPGAGSGDVASIGLGATDHPLLGAAISVADSGSIVLSGRISLSSQSWLAGHRVHGAAVVPGAALVELAVHAGDQLGLPVLDELTVLAPLVIPEDSPVQVQISVGDPDEQGTSTVTIHSRGGDGQAWTRHAMGTLGSASSVVPADLTVWPPAGAQPVDVTTLYDDLAATGLQYGPLFRGLRRAWRGADGVYAEVELDASAAAGFAVHPALLDSALHAVALTDTASGMPFSFRGVTVHATGATAARVHVRPGQGDTAIFLADPDGAPLVSVESLALRPIAVPSAVTGADVLHPSLFAVDWTELPTPADPAAADLEVVRIGSGWATGPVDAESETIRVLALLQDTLRNPAGKGVAFVTRGAVSCEIGEDVTDLAGAAAAGLVRSARAENPDVDLRLIDVDASDDTASEALGLACTDEPQVAVRAGTVRVPRLAHATNAGLLPLPAESWRLSGARVGSIDAVSVVPCEADATELGPLDVRVAVRAAGVNFRDVMNVLDMYPGDAGWLGLECAGVVTELGSAVTDLQLGDRVFGMTRTEAFATTAICERDMITRMPRSWTFAQAAAAPIVCLTAYYALHDLAALQAGEKILIHAAAGGVGKAATQLAHHLGAEVYATASPAKWAHVDTDTAHLASSRTLDFETTFLQATGGAGMDVVLDSLAGDFVDASLRLLPHGGRFVEMGKTDIRDAAQVATDHPGVVYRDFDLIDAGTTRIGQMFTELLHLIDAGALNPLPMTAYDVREAHHAFRFLAQARNVGKVVLTIPRTPDPEHTIVVTGGTGAIGALTARHLVTAHGAKHLVLTSRSGMDAPGAVELQAELTALGATVAIARCDLTDADAIAALIAEHTSDEHPLAAVIHSAGTVDDATVASLTPERIRGVFAAKTRAADAITAALAAGNHDLAALTFFSSAAGSLGAPGQGNYAAANSYLDALAQHQHVQGLPTRSIAWGLWHNPNGPQSGMAAHLTDTDIARMTREGMTPLSPADGVALFDASHATSTPHTVALHLKPTAPVDQLPPIMRSLSAAPKRAVAARAMASSGLAARLAGAADPMAIAVEVVRAEVATTLGHTDASRIGLDEAFTELGFDSLTSVELRNKLNAATGLKLPTTVVFDHPTITSMATLLIELVGGPRTAVTTTIATRRTDDDPIVIVGMACHFPGGADSPADLWEIVRTGQHVLTPFPTDRGWDTAALFDPTETRPGTSYVDTGSFLTTAAQFDPAFFGISPREAYAMDPQQRLLLETSWEAIESSGIDPTSLRGTRTGVYAGSIYHDYASRPQDVPEGVDAFLGTGTSGGVLSGRVSYALGLEGPAISIDTACSSSLVALHLAAQSLSSGECDLALAGGVTIMPSANPFIDFSLQHGLARDSRCKAFGAGADGTSWGEGVGMLVLERESVARAAGHRVLAVLRGSAVNQDGASNGLTAPNGPSQQRVIRQALASADLTPADVDVVEAHGTGTALGDPIEAQALSATYGADRTTPVLLGSIKSNIGHTQAAAGVAGVIKMVEAMHRGVVPQTLHADEPSEHIDWDESGLAVNSDNVAWPAVDRPRRSAVSSFGFSGTNAHVILEQGDAPVATDAVDEPAATVWPVSARTASALAAQARRLLTAVETGTLHPADVAATLATRATHTHRGFATGRTADELLAGLRDLADSGPASNAPTRTAVVFTGQGAQWAGMGASLHATYPVFAATFDEICAVFDKTSPTDVSLRDVVFGDTDGIDDTTFTQPALFAFETALYRLLESFGVTATVVAGHSVGEITAAHIAGLLTLPDAVRLVEARARLMGALPGGGAMAAVNTDETTLRALLPTGVEIAASNAPTSLVVSGPEAAVSALLSQLKTDGIRGKQLTVSHAFHSALMTPMLDDFKAAIAGIQYGTPTIPIVSTLTGGPADMANVTYWADQIRGTVRYTDAVTTIATDHNPTAILEIGPDAALTPVTAQTVEIPVIPTLRRGHDQHTAVLTALATLWTTGHPVDWTTHTTGHHIDLPTYPFERQSFWLASGGGPAVGTAEAEFWNAVEDEDIELVARTLRAERHEPLAEVVPWLSAWRRNSASDDLFAVSWRPVVTPAPKPLHGAWIVAGPAPASFVDALRSRGALPVPVADDATVSTALSNAGLEDGDVAGVVAFTRRDDLVVGSAHLWLATGDWAAGRVLAADDPDHWGGVLGLPDELTPDLADLAVSVLAGHLPDDQVAVTAAGLLAPRLTPVLPGRADLGATVLFSNADDAAVETFRAAHPDTTILVGDPRTDLTPDVTGVVHVAGAPADEPAVLAALADVAHVVLVAPGEGLLGAAGHLDAAGLVDLHRRTVQDRAARGLAGTAIAGGAGRVLETGRPVLLVAEVDWTELLADVADDLIPALFAEVPAVRTLLTLRAQQAEATAQNLADELQSLAPDDRRARVVETVRRAVAQTLGQADTDLVDVSTSFRDLGFSSLSAVELRDRLIRVTGRRITATAVFDHPTCVELAEFVQAGLLPETEHTVELPVQLDRIESALRSADSQALVNGRIEQRLRALLDLCRGDVEQTTDSDAGDSLADASVSEVLAFIDNELGMSDS